LKRFRPGGRGRKAPPGCGSIGGAVPGAARRPHMALHHESSRRGMKALKPSNPSAGDAGFLYSLSVPGFSADSRERFRRRMSKRTTFLLPVIFLFLVPATASGEGVWKKYLDGNDIGSIALAGENIWCSTDGGLVVWNRRDGSHVRYTRDDGLASNRIGVVSLDRRGNPWFTYEDPLYRTRVTCREDGNWVIYDDSNSGIPDAKVRTVFFAENGDWWIGTIWGGIVRYDGSEWKNYVPEKVVGIPRKIVVDEEGTAWVATSEGVWAFDGAVWKNYTTGDGLVSDNVNDIAIDGGGVKWFATMGGVSSFDGSVWRSYTKTDGLVHNKVNTVAVDHDGVKWFGTDNGVSRFDGVGWESYTEDDELVNDVVTKIVEDGDRNLWFCHDDVAEGVTMYDGKEWIWFTMWGDKGGNYVPTNDIRTAAVDGNGILWFGTGDGLLSWDGEEWNAYTTRDGLAGAEISEVYVGPDGAKWVIYDRNEHAGITRFDGEDWTTYDEGNGLPTDVVTAVGAGPDGVVYIGTTRGVSVFDGTGWSHHPGSDRLASPTVFDILEDGDGVVWFATSKGLTRFDGVSWRTYHTGKPSYDDVVSIRLAGDGTLWCLSSFGKLMKLSGGSLVPVAVGGGTGAAGSSPKIGCFVFDRDGVLWAVAAGEVVRNDGTGLWEKELWSFDGTAWERRVIGSEHRFGEVTGIEVDEDGVLWLATDNGLRRYDGASLSAYVIDCPPDNFVADIVVDNHNNVIVATGGGISMYDTESRGWRFISGESVRSIAVDRENVLWVADPLGVLRYDWNEWTLYEEIDGVDVYRTLVYFIDEDNVKWIGTTWGLWRYDGVSWKHYDEDDGAPLDSYRDIAIDGNGVMWIAAGINKGVVRFDGAVWEKHVNELTDDTVDAIVVDGDNRKWFGTRNGLTCFNDTVWTSYTVGDGLVSNAVRALAVDNDNVLWVGTDGGVSRFDGVSWTSYTVEDGLVDDDVRTIAVDYNNVKWFGTAHGISSLDDRPAGVSGGKPEMISLRGNFPNPFNKETTIEFDLYTWGDVCLDIYDVLGRRVRGYVFRDMTAGSKDVLWDGRSGDGSRVSSGIYLYRISKGKHEASGKMLLMK